MSYILIFLQKAINQSLIMLYGADGEILTQKSGNLNLGVPGIMYMGGIGGLIGAFLYEKSAAHPNAVLGLIISVVCSLLCSALAALLYSFLTISLRANQNVTGLALTTFGVGFGNFFGGSLSKLAGGVGQVSVPVTSGAYQASIPFLRDIPVLGELFFKRGFMFYLSIIITVLMAYFLKKTRKGLNLRAVGENPATADAAGINVARYKYIATVIGGMISGLGGLYFVMDFSGGTWTNNGLGENGWLAVALVIFAMWKPLNAIWGSLVFGGLCILFLYIPGLNQHQAQLIRMLPYVITIIVLIVTSLRKKREQQPPAHLGLPYFREER
ncbi:MAG: ABC transporter permease [Butyrivibrio sp.]|nr:ABC transporter permease [Butyrivibrio sp.]